MQQNKPKAKREKTGGRKPLSADDPTVTITTRVTPKQKQKHDKLGGPRWVRRMIDEADEPD